MSKKLLNILLCAYACEPHKGSEPGVGWETSLHLSYKMTNANFFVVTRKNNKESINKESFPSNLNFIYYDLPKLFLFIKKTIPITKKINTKKSISLNSL